MKNVIYLIVLLFLLVLMSTSCEKDESLTPNVPDDTTTAPINLNGSWEFVSLDWSQVKSEFNGQITNNCDPYKNLDYAYVTLNFYNMTENSVMLYTDCVDNNIIDNRTYSYTLSNNIIDCDNGSRKFQILNADNFNGNELKLKLISAKTTGLPINGTYTLHKK